MYMCTMRCLQFDAIVYRRNEVGHSVRKLCTLMVSVDSRPVIFFLLIVHASACMTACVWRYNGISEVSHTTEGENQNESCL